MTLIVLILLFLAAVLMAIGANTPAAVCSRVGTILLAVGFGLQLFVGLR
jgi:hypothetical protein